MYDPIEETMCLNVNEVSCISDKYRKEAAMVILSDQSVCVIFLVSPQLAWNLNLGGTKNGTRCQVFLVEN